MSNENLYITNSYRLGTTHKALIIIIIFSAIFMAALHPLLAVGVTGGLLGSFFIFVRKYPHILGLTYKNEANALPVEEPNEQEATNEQRALLNRLEELTLVEDISRQLARSVNFEQIEDKMLEIAQRVTNADHVTLRIRSGVSERWRLIDRDKAQNTTRKTYTLQAEANALDTRIIELKQPICVEDIKQSPLHILTNNNANSLLAIPLIKDDGVIGILTVESAQFRYFTKVDCEILMHLAQHTVIAIENSDLLEEHAHRIIVLSSLEHLNRQLSGLLDTPTVEKALIETVQVMFDAQDSTIFHYEPTTGEIAKHDSDGLIARTFSPSIMLQAAQCGEICVTQEVTTLDVEDQLLTFVSVPILRNNVVRAVLCASFAEGRYLHERDLDGLDVLAKRAGDYLEKAQLHERISASNDRMSAILKSTHDGILLLDREGQLVECNAIAERFFGIKKEDFINKNFVGMLLHLMDTNNITSSGYSRAELADLAQELTARPNRINKREVKGEYKGQPLIIEEVGSPVTDSHHRISGRLFVFRDITEQKQVEAFRNDIVNMAVHDLRGPLGAIISGLKLVQEDFLDPENQYSREDTLKMLDLSLNSAENLVQLVESVLEIAKLETNEMVIKQTFVQLSELMQEAYHTLMPSFHEAKIQIDFLIPPKFRLALIDRDLIRRVIINLLDNALRHTPTGGRVLVTVNPSTRSLQQMTIYIADSGKGIPVHEHKNIFEYFRQVKSNIPMRGAKGSGLGLTFCKLAVEAHNGKIWVEPNSPLSGACIAFCIPYAPISAELPETDKLKDTPMLNPPSNVLPNSAVSNSAVF